MAGGSTATSSSATRTGITSRGCRSSRRSSRPGNVWHVYGPRGLDTSIDKTLAGQMQYTYFPVQLLDFGATIDYHDLVEGQFEIDDVASRRGISTTRADARLPHRGRRRDRRVLDGPRADGRIRSGEPDAIVGGRFEPRGGATRGVPPRRRPRDPRRAVPRRGVPRQGRLGPQSDGVRGRRRPGGRAERMALFHHDPLRDDDALDGLVGSAGSAASWRGRSGGVRRRRRTGTGADGGRAGRESVLSARREWRPAARCWDR